LLSMNPARVFDLPGGTLVEGGPADITVLAPDAAVTIRARSLTSKSKNTPFDGWSLKGATAATVVGGRALYVNADLPGLAALAHAMPASPSPRIP
jgi:dihydroorotase